MTIKISDKVLRDLQKFEKDIEAGKYPDKLPKSVAKAMAMMVGAMFVGEHAITAAEQRGPDAAAKVAAKATIAAPAA